MPKSGSGAGAVRLQDVMGAERYTAWYGKNGNLKDVSVMGRKHSAIDHVLVAPELAERVFEVRVDRTVPVH